MVLRPFNGVFNMFTRNKLFVTKRITVSSFYLIYLQNVLGLFIG